MDSLVFQNSYKNIQFFFQVFDPVFKISKKKRNITNFTYVRFCNKIANSRIFRVKNVKKF